MPLSFILTLLAADGIMMNASAEVYSSAICFSIFLSTTLCLLSAQVRSAHAMTWYRLGIYPLASQKEIEVNLNLRL